MFHKMKNQLVTTILFISCLLTPFIIQAKEKGPEILVSSKITQGSDVSYVKKLKHGRLDLSKNASFAVKAGIVPITQSREVLFEETSLPLPDSELVCRDFSCTRNWSADLSGQDISIMDRPKLELAWTQSSQAPTPRIKVVAEFEAENSTQKNSTITLTGIFHGQNKDYFSTFKTYWLNNGGQYSPKDKWYLFKREFGLSAGQSWRYSRDSDHLVLQKRVDLPAEKATGVRIRVDKDYIPQTINFSVDKDGNGCRDAYILENQIQKKVEYDGDTAIITLNLARAFKRNRIDPSKAKIMEPIIFLPMSLNNYKRIKPIEKVSFGSLGFPAQETFFRPDVEQGSDRYSLAFDFMEKISSLGLWNARYKNIQVQIELNSPQVIQWEQFRLYSSFAGQVPKILLRPEQALKEWGVNGLYPGRFRRVASFAPVMHVAGAEKTPGDKKFIESLSRTKISSGLISITGPGQWFALKKSPKELRIKAYPSRVAGNAAIRLLPAPKDREVQFKTDVLERIIVQEMGQDAFNLPLKYLTRGNKLYLPKGEALELTVPAERQQMKDNSLNLNSTQPYPDPWQISLAFDQRISTGDDLETGDKDYNIWQSGSFVVKDALNYSQKGSDSLTLNFELAREGRQKSQKIMLKSSSGRVPGLQPGDKITNIQIASLKAKVGSNDPGFALFNLAYSKEFSLDKIRPDQLSWYDYQEVLPLRPGPNILLDEKRDLAYLAAEENKNNVWSFYLPEQDLIKPEKIHVYDPGQEFRYIISQSPTDEQDISDSRAINLKSKDWSLQDFKLNISCPATKKAFSKIEIPKISVLGIKDDLKSHLKDVGVSINGKKILNKDMGIFRSTNSSQWTALGRADLGPGNHTIGFVDNKFFQIDSVLLETSQNLYSLEELSQAEPGSKGSILAKLLSLVVKVIIFAAICFVIYLFRGRIKSGWQRFFKLFSRAYWFLPEEAWTLLWFLLSLMIYALSLTYDFQPADFGGICLVVFLWHLSRLFRSWFEVHFGKMAVYIYRDGSTPFFAWAIVLLIFTAVFVSLGLEPVAEQVAVMVYYLLVAGVVGQLMSLKRGETEE